MCFCFLYYNISIKNIAGARIVNNAHVIQVRLFHVKQRRFKMIIVNFETRELNMTKTLERKAPVYDKAEVVKACPSIKTVNIERQALTKDGNHPTGEKILEVSIPVAVAQKHLASMVEEAFDKNLTDVQKAEVCKLLYHALDVVVAVPRPVKAKA